MSRERLPFIGSSGRQKAAKGPHSSPALQRPHRRKLTQQQPSSSSSSSHPHPGPSSLLLSDSTMTPWTGLELSESSFTSIPTAVPPRPPPLPPPPPPPPPPLPPPAPQPTPSTPYRARQEEEEESSSSNFSSEVPSPPLDAPNSAAAAEKGLRMRRRVLPQRRLPRPPRLPPLRPVTNLSFSRSFTFSFFELPLHQSPRWRAERIRNLLLLLRQIHY